MKTTIMGFALTALLLPAAAGTAAAQYNGYNPYYSDVPPPPGYYAPAPPRVVVRPYRQQPYFDDYSNYYPAVRGFGDRNPVPRGNMRGCTVDLGYGRYESCDK